MSHTLVLNTTDVLVSEHVILYVGPRILHSIMGTFVLLFFCNLCFTITDLRERIKKKSRNKSGLPGGKRSSDKSALIKWGGERTFLLLWTTDKARGKENTYKPNDRDEFNSREFGVCDGWVCDLESIGAPSMLRLIRSAVSLSRMWSTLDLICEENAVRRKWKVDYTIWTPEAARNQFIITDKAKASRGGGKVSVLWKTKRYILRKLKPLTH